MTTIKMFVVDDVDEMLRKREDALRLSMSAEKHNDCFLFTNY